MDVYWKAGDISRALLPLWVERWRAAKIHPQDKVCIFTLVLPDDKILIYEGNQMIISKTKFSTENMNYIVDEINQFCPSWMLLYPGLAGFICKMTEEGKIPLISSLSYIELTGEMVIDGLKNRLDSEGMPVPDGITGNVYVTSLQNYAMPIVRYGIGDCGKFKMVEINNRQERVFELTKARKNDKIVLANGQKILPDVLLKPIELINSAISNCVYQFQARQKTHNVICLYFV